MILSGEVGLLKRLDQVYADRVIGRSMPITFSELLSLTPASPFEARLIRCEVCGSSEPYDPMKVRQGWPCERCHKQGLACCIRMVVREFKPVSLCLTCMAELELSGSPVERSYEPLPGKEAK
jgi:hypothetical protein